MNDTHFAFNKEHAFVNLNNEKVDIYLGLLESEQRYIHTYRQTWTEFINRFKSSWKVLTEEFYSMIIHFFKYKFLT